MANLLELSKSLLNLVPFLKNLALFIIIYFGFVFILNFTEKRLLRRAKTKKQITNIEVFSKLIKYAVLLILLVLAIFSYSGSWEGLGLTVGLLSAALGWALQKPITGIAAWIMLVTKRPFEIGDRVVIGDVKGDVADITLTHVYLKELGGVIKSEENSGRLVMIPNSLLFEKDIVNYTANDDYVLDEVIALITYESNMDKAMQICLEAAKEHTKSFADKVPKKPHIRTYFQPSGVNVHIRYFSPAMRMPEYASKITKEIYDKIKKTRSVEIAYPHLVMKRK